MTQAQRTTRTRRLVSWCARHPRRTLSVAAALAVAAIVLAITTLELKTSNLDLIDPDLPAVRRFNDFANAFGTPNVLAVVLEGDDPETVRRAVDALGPPLRALPGVRAVVDRPPFDADALRIAGLDAYLLSHDQRLAVVFVQPDDATSDVVTLAPFVASVRATLASAQLDRTGVRAGVTGLPAYALDDRDVIQRDISRQSVVAVVLVFLLFATAFGRARRPLAAVLTLVLAVAVVLGVVSIVPGHLTLLSAFFASILFGLGIDYGIHVVDRVEELIASGLTELEAVVEALDGLAPALTTSASTTSSVLFVLAFSGFRGFAELGIIAGLGVLVCLLATFTVLPAWLSLTPERRTSNQRRPSERRMGRWLWRLQRWPLALALGVSVLVAALLPSPPFDRDYLNLQPVDSETVRWEREMVRRSDFSPVFAAFTVDSMAAVKALTWDLVNEDTVGAVRSLRDFGISMGGDTVLPDLPPETLRTFRDANGRLAVYAYPADDTWSEDAQRRFVDAMQAIDPEVTGMPVLGRFMIDRAERARRVATQGGVVLLMLWVLIHFRRPLPALLAAAPAILTLASLGAIMRWAGLSFNPLNVMALPIVLGIAVDDGVHLVHRFLDEAGDLERTLVGTGRALTLTTATTLVAFGALAWTSHRGLASFALTLSLGVAVAWVLSLLVLPQVLHACRGALLRREGS